VYLREGKNKLATLVECSKLIQAFTTEVESFLRANGVSTQGEIVAGGLNFFLSETPTFQTLPPLVGAALQKDAARNCILFLSAKICLP
jgi:hypothetical protein